MSAVATKPALAARDIVKTFGHVTALDGVDFEVSARRGRRADG